MKILKQVSPRLVCTDSITSFILDMGERVMIFEASSSTTLAGEKSMFYFSDALIPKKCHYWEEVANVRSIGHWKFTQLPSIG